MEPHEEDPGADMLEVLSLLLGQRVGRAHMPLHGAGPDAIVYGSPNQGYLHVNWELMRQARGADGG